MSESAFFQDLAVLMAAAGLVAVVFQKLGWPKVLGYIFAGAILGGRLWGGTSLLADGASVRTVGSLGIVFLMLTLGLEFSAGALKKTKSVSVPMAVLDTAVMVWIGYTVGRRIFGWTSVESVFLGAAICDSATTLLAKTIDEMKWTGRQFVKYVISTSVLEDMMCVGVIALATGVAGGKGFSIGTVCTSLGALGVFTVCTIVLGFVLVPRLLNAVAKTGNDETLLLSLLGCCFFVSWIAYRLDFSLALGAFLIGITGASSSLRHRLVKLADPLRSMFAAMFFVTVGCLADPRAFAANAWAILLLSCVVVAGKALNCFAVSILAGQPVKISVQTALGLAQTGEFAYMVAILYMAITGDASSAMCQIAVGVSLVTTCLSPFLLKLSEPAGDWLEKRIPPLAAKWLSQYNVWLARLRSAPAQNAAAAQLRKNAAFLCVCWILMFALSVAASMLDGRDWSGFSGFFDAHKKAFFALAANIGFLALLKPVWIAGRRMGDAAGDLMIPEGGATGGEAWRSAIRGAARSFTAIAVAAVTAAEIFMMDVNLMPQETSVRIGIVLALAIAIPVAVKYMWPAVGAAGRRFKAAVEAEAGMASRQGVRDFAIPGGGCMEIRIAEGSPACGSTIRELDIRAKTGASVVAVSRGGLQHGNPPAEWRFEAGDSISAIGSAAQLSLLMKELAPEGAS